ncbi:ComF family protein [Pedobacter insulae]|uniref:ComF family protein n=1 Tax=Pedobacter insulae TaxID=414048 RepID=A0A1I2TDL5_9SPHI|nr:ComF family protein [Pedobacter insulae]SFG62950.1 comF family protein [Pedobacter insulae]
MLQIKHLALDVIGLLFPNLCGGCGLSLYNGEEAICLRCMSDLPYTDFHLHQQNLVAKQLWGRLPFEAAMAMLYFKKGTKTQNLIHNLKYNGKTQVGVKLGGLLGEKLNDSEYYKDVDYIIPVPLHHKKERERGYNQSSYIAKGVAARMNVPVKENKLIRKRVTETQTKKSRYNRYENMLTVFEIVDPAVLKNKHILLLDDVITTGATLEACGNSLLKCGIKKLSIAGLAFAQ